MQWNAMDPRENIQDSSADGRTPCEKRSDTPFGGATWPLGAAFLYTSISQTDTARFHQHCKNTRWLTFSSGMLTHGRWMERKNLRRPSRQEFISKTSNHRAVPIDTCGGKSYSHVQTDRTNKRFTWHLVITAFDCFIKKIRMWRGGSDDQRHSQPHRRAGGDSVAAELFLATHQVAERKATDHFQAISLTITLNLAVRFTCPANRRSRRF